MVVLEREGLIGSHTSSRNSEVIHAGIYYPEGSAKARLCVRGRELLYAYCASRGVPHRRLGKIIVATEPAQDGGARGDRGGGGGERGRRPRGRSTAADLARLEPALRGVAGLLSPSTGIIDSHALMLSLPGRGSRTAGGAVALTHRLPSRRRRHGGGFVVEAESGGETGDGSAADLLVNAAGLFAGEVAAGDRGAGGALGPPGLLLQGQLFRRSRPGCPSAT